MVRVISFKDITQILNWALWKVKSYIILGYIFIFISEIQKKSWLECYSEIFTAAGSTHLYKVAWDVSGYKFWYFVNYSWFPHLFFPWKIADTRKISRYIKIRNLYSALTNQWSLLFSVDKSQGKWRSAVALQTPPISHSYT